MVTNQSYSVIRNLAHLKETQKLQSSGAGMLCRLLCLFIPVASPYMVIVSPENYSLTGSSRISIRKLITSFHSLLPLPFPQADPGLLLSGLYDREVFPRVRPVTTAVRMSHPERVHDECKHSPQEVERHDLDPSKIRTIFCGLGSSHMHLLAW